MAHREQRNRQQAADMSPHAPDFVSRLRATQQSQGSGWWALAANSSLAFAFGYLVAHLTYQVGLAVFGAIVEREPTLFHSRVTFAEAGTDAAFSGGVLATLLLTLVAIIVYRRETDYGPARFFGLWIMLHAAREGLTQVAAVAFTSDSDLARAFEAAGFPSVGGVLLSIVAIVALAGVAIAAAPAFLKFAPNREMVAAPARRFRFVLVVAAVPWVIGAALAAAALWPDAGASLASGIWWSGLMVAVTILAAIPVDQPVIPFYHPMTRLAWPGVLAVAVILVVFYLIPPDGVLIPPW